MAKNAGEYKPNIKLNESRGRKMSKEVKKETARKIQEQPINKTELIKLFITMIIFSTVGYFIGELIFK